MMKIPAALFFALLVLPACRKKEISASETQSFSGIISNALTQERVGGCPVYLLHPVNHQVLAETLSDSEGRFQLHCPSGTIEPLIHFAHNAFAWETPRIAKPHAHYPLRPYVPVNLILKQQAPYQVCQLTGSFNETGLWLPAVEECTTIISASVFDTLTIHMWNSAREKITTTAEWIGQPEQEIPLHY